LLQGNADMETQREDVARFERALSGDAQGGSQPAPAKTADRERIDGGAEAARSAAANAAAAAALAARMATPSPSESGSIAPAASSAGEDDLLRIRGVDEDVVDRLNELGVDRFNQIASWSAADVDRVNDALGARRKVEQQNWIEQAHILSQGRETAYSESLVRINVGVVPTPHGLDEPSPRVAVRSQVPARAPQAEPTPPAALAVQSVASAQAEQSAIEPDVGAPDVAKRAAFVRRSASPPLAQTSMPPEVEEASPAQGAAASGSSDEPTAQAAARPARLFEAIQQNRARGGAPGEGRNDVSGLRSVRSEALRRGDPDGSGGGGQSASTGRVVRSAIPDDLKRIRGVGVLIEKRLNGLGVTNYDQIANWTRADVMRISQQLDFKGRVERENWIEQSRILAAGGQTEFSRRVDRGEVESNPRSRGNDD